MKELIKILQDNNLTVLLSANSESMVIEIYNEDADSEKIEFKMNNKLTGYDIRKKFMEAVKRLKTN